MKGKYGINPDSGQRERLLRIAMVIQCYHPAIGGAEKQLKSLVPFLQKRNCEVHIFTRHRPGLPFLEIIDGVPVHRIPSPGPKAVASLSFTFRSVLELKRLQPHLIHAHELLSPTTTAVAASKMMGTPVVAKVLGGGCLGDLAKLNRTSIGQQRIRVYARWVDRFITVSSEIDGELMNAGVPVEKRCSIPNGVDTDRFVPVDAFSKMRKRSELQLGGAPIAVYTGRLAKEKRLDKLVNLWPSIREKHPFASLFLIGMGEEEEKLRAIQTRGVYVVGAVHDVLPYLQAADLFILPSEREGLSNAMLEAMSCGLPVVVTNVGGAMDVIESGRNGFAVPVDADAQTFGTTLMRVMGDPKLREMVGKEARETILQKYSLIQTANALRSLYDSLLGHSTETSLGKDLRASA